MANWDQFREGMSRTADMAARKAGEVGDAVKLRYKLHRARAELRDTYEKIGRLTYDQLHFHHDRALEINNLLPEVGRLRDQIRRLNNVIKGDENAVYCSNCGTQLTPEMDYCPGCGKPQPRPATAETTDTVAADEV
ncbi:MAG: zinc-ribbon domain-containing protein [Clostridia bacterium]|nr:zinc-ribbon domain-containing protein [Clostridia bacterium]